MERYRKSVSPAPVAILNVNYERFDLVKIIHRHRQRVAEAETEAEDEGRGRGTGRGRG